MEKEGEGAGLGNESRMYMLIRYFSNKQSYPGTPLRMNTQPETSNELTVEVMLRTLHRHASWSGQGVILMEIWLLVNTNPSP